LVANVTPVSFVQVLFWSFQYSVGVIGSVSVIVTVCPAVRFTTQATATLQFVQVRSKLRVP
jgi:hypothetical protein